MSFHRQKLSKLFTAKHLGVVAQLLSAKAVNWLHSLGSQVEFMEICVFSTKFGSSLSDSPDPNEMFLLSALDSEALNANNDKWAATELPPKEEQSVAFEVLLELLSLDCPDEQVIPDHVLHPHRKLWWLYDSASMNMQCYPRLKRWQLSPTFLGSMENALNSSSETHSSKLMGYNVLLWMEDTTADSYINHEGGLFSQLFFRLAQQILLWRPGLCC